MYKKTFKQYKSKCPPPDLSDVIDFRHENKMKHVNRLSITSDLNITETDLDTCGLKSICDWNIFELIDKPGFLVMPDPFTATGQRYWIRRALSDFTRKPLTKLNIDAHGDLDEGEDWWELSCKSEARSHNILKKLRWATLGYHHNWDTKIYSENNKGPFPEDLAQLCKIISTAVGFPKFNAEAAIVNYYHFGSTLSGHTDHSEHDITAPLLSFSFGQSAVFLLGGQTLEDPTTAVMLRSGDVTIMSGPSRLAYHGVPLILSDTLAPWGRDNGEQWAPFDSYVSNSRININVRQVLPPGQQTLSELSQEQ